MRLTRKYSRYFAYCRVSGEEQGRTGTSLDGQQDAHTRFSAAQGLPPPTFFIEVESATEAKIEARTEQLRLQREADADTLIGVTELDRWSRDVVHAVSTVRTLVRRNVGWVAIYQEIDATTEDGQERLNQEAVDAEKERRKIYRRTQGRKRALTDAGLYVRGQAPTGFKIEKRRLVLHPEEAPIAREAVERAARGEGLTAIAASLPLLANRRTWDKAGLARLIRSRYLLGESPDSSGTWRKTHEPIVDRDTWERAGKSIRERDSKGRPHLSGETDQRLLRGLARCAFCGHAISITFGRPRESGGRRMGYWCRYAIEGKCSARSVHAEKLDALVSSMTLARLIEIREDLAKPGVAEKVAKPRVDYEGEQRKIATRRAKLISMAMNETISEDDLRRHLAELDVELARLGEAREADERAQREQERLAQPEARRALLADVEQITRRWERAGVGVKRAILERLAKRIEVGPTARKFSHGVDAPKVEWRGVGELLGG